MELRHLRYFCAVAEHGTFSQASRQLRVSQSALSEQIADLEREVGGQLFDRGHRRPSLTAQGKVFLVEARKTLAAAERTLDETRRSLDGHTGTLAIGFFLWGAGGFFAQLIREYRRQFPQVRLSLNEMNTNMQMEALSAGKIDVGIARPLEAPYDQTLRAELLYRDPIVAALPQEHRLRGRRIRLQELAGEPFVINQREAAPTLHDSILGLCASAGFTPQIVNASAAWSSVLTLVESGEGVALVPAGARFLKPAGVRFCELEPETTHIGISVVWNPQREGPILRGFLRLVRENKERIAATAAG
ncbi:MAG: LysR family transcriptional regulator [Acidobacteriota bacterium]|nr:LysR family transcriptional regulator [Acidobacteriota bacterium]